METPRLHRNAKLCLIVALLLAGIWIAFSFIPALVWAGVIGIAISPLYERAETRFPKLRGGILLPTLFTLGFAIIVLAPIAFGIAQAASETGDLTQWLISARANGIPEPEWLKHIPFEAKELEAWWQANLSTPEGTARQFEHLNAAALMAHSRTLGAVLVHRAVIFAFTVIGLFFVLKDHDSISSQLQIAGNRIFGVTGERLVQQVVLSVRGTINGLVLVGIAEGVVMTFFYWFAGIPRPLLLGAFTAVAAMIPFGAVVMFAIASGLAIAQNSIAWAVAIFVIGLIVVFIADHFARPVLIGGATRLPFLWVLIGILGGVETIGLLGLFVGPGVMAALMMLWRELIETAPHSQRGAQSLQ